LNSAAGPSTMPPLPRNSSYNSYNPTWFDRSGDVYYSNEPAQKRYRPSRGHSYHDSGIGPSIGPSPLASNLQSEGTSSTNSLQQTTFPSQLGNRLTSDAEVSPVVSSGNSQKSTTSDSSDNLEISVTPKPNRNSQRPKPIVYAEKDIFSRLHTSTTRKLGEAPLYETRPPVQLKTPTATIVAQNDKPKKQRWSLLGKKNTVAV